MNHPRDGALLAFCTFFNVAMIVAIVAPYLRRKTELLTAMNIFLLGSIIFVGLSGYNSVYTGHYFEYSNKVFTLFFVGITLFYMVLFLTYYYAKFPRKLAASLPAKWPPNKLHVMIGLTLVSLAVAAMQLARLDIPGVGKLLFNIGVVAPTFALALSLAMWWRHKGNLFYIVLMLCVFAVSVYSAFSLGGGRRPLYGTLAIFPLAMYWWWLRHWNPKAVMLLGALAFLPIPVIDQAYNSVRWTGHGTLKLDRTEGASQRFGDLLDRLQNQQSVKLMRMGQTSVEYSLVATKFYATDEIFETSPFHATITLLTFPIPRTMWPDKPRHLGLFLGQDTGALPKWSNNNVGPGIVGHAFHEGGLHMIVFYGVVAGAALRYFDTLLTLHSGNPILLGCLSASAGHILGWVRGDLSSFSLWIVCAFVFAMVLNLVGRAMGGVAPPAMAADSAVGWRWRHTDENAVQH